MKKINKKRSSVKENSMLIKIDQEVLASSLTGEEEVMIQQWRQRVSKAPQSPLVVKKTENKDGSRNDIFEATNGRRISDMEQGSELLNATLNLATGSRDAVFGANLWNDCSYACSHIFKEGKQREQVDTSILNTLCALQPQDEIEGMLITRLIALHSQSMRYLTCTNHEEATVEGIDRSINRSTKFMRLYNETLEALMRYRRKGEQRVTVQHVQVNDGGQAIVGSILNQGGGGDGQKK